MIYRSIKRLTFSWSVLLLTWMQSNLLFAQDLPKLNYRSLTTKDGLSSNYVSSITQSSDNRIWIGTTKGLNVFDGNRIENIYKGNSFYDLKFNYIIDMAIDKGDYLFLSNIDFVQSLNIRNGKSLEFPNTKDVIFFDQKDKKVSFSCIGHLYQSSGPIIKSIGSKLNQNGKEIPITPANLSIGQNHKMAYSNSALIVFDKSLNIDSIYKISSVNNYFASNGDLWINTWSNGIYRIDANTKQLNKKFDLNQSNGCRFIEWKIYHKSYLLLPIGTGFYLYDALDDQLLSYNELNGVPNNFFIDAENNLWVATSNGVRIFSSLSQNLKAIKVSDDNDGEVYQINEIGDYYWLSQRYFKGFFQFDKNWKLIKKYNIFERDYKNENHLSDAYYFHYYNGFVYATGDFGIFKINPQSGNVNQICKTTQDIKLRTILPIDQHHWLIRSFNQGVYVFDAQNETLTSMDLLAFMPKETQFNFLYKTKTNGILITTTKGIYQYNDNKFEIFDKEQLPIKSYYGIAEDADEILWLGSTDGVECYDLKSKKFINIIHIPLNIGSVLRITTDHENNVWISAESGYYQYNKKLRKILRLEFEEGILGHTDQPFVFINQANEKFLAGNGLIYKLEEAIFSSLKQNPFVFEINTSKQKITHLNVDDNQQTLILQPGTTLVDINVSYPTFTLNKPFRYFYKIGEQWMPMNNGNINLTNLNVGKLKIDIKAEHKLNLNEVPIKSLYLEVLPFWYQTIWWKLFLVIIGLGLLYLLLRWREKMRLAKLTLQHSYDLRVLDLEMQNLRTQMNPHFIFNSLNSINSFIVESKTHLASDYLTKFSKLIRLILELSKSDTIPLSKELEVLRLYLKMESLRFRNSFNYQIIIEDEDGLSDIAISPMIIQPFVENAIWHGLMQKSGERQLYIKISLDKALLKIMVEDNGIGREKAKELKSKSSTDKKSYGMEITYKRIKHGNPANTVTITDLYENGIPTGTRVEIKIGL